MSHGITRAGFQAESLILLYLNSDKLTWVGNIHAKEKYFPVQALNPLLLLVSLPLPHFAMNPAQQRGVQLFLGGTSFLSIRSLLTRVLTLMETQ